MLSLVLRRGLPVALFAAAYAVAGCGDGEVERCTPSTCPLVAGDGYLVNATDKPVSFRLQQLPPLHLDGRFQAGTIPFSLLTTAPVQDLSLGPGEYVRITGSMRAFGIPLPTALDGTKRDQSFAALLTLNGQALLLRSSGLAKFIAVGTEVGVQASITPITPTTAELCSEPLTAPPLRWNTVPDGWYRIRGRRWDATIGCSFVSLRAVELQDAPFPEADRAADLVPTEDRDLEFCAPSDAWPFLPESVVEIYGAAPDSSLLFARGADFSLQAIRSRRTPMPGSLSGASPSSSSGSCIEVDPSCHAVRRARYLRNQQGEPTQYTTGSRFSSVSPLPVLPRRYTTFVINAYENIVFGEACNEAGEVIETVYVASYALP